MPSILNPTCLPAIPAARCVFCCFSVTVSGMSCVLQMLLQVKQAQLDILQVRVQTAVLRNRQVSYTHTHVRLFTPPCTHEYVCSHTLQLEANAGAAYIWSPGRARTELSCVRVCARALLGSS